MKKLKKTVSFLCIVVLLFTMIPFSTQSAYAQGVVLQQTDSRWGSYPYGQSTLAPSACGTFANLNALSYLLKHNFTVDEIHAFADYAGVNCYAYGQGSYHTITQSIASKFGSQYNYKCTEYWLFSRNNVTLNGSAYPITSTGMQIVWDKLTSELQEGRVAVGLVYGHFIALVDYDPQNDKVLVYDSAASMEKRGTTTNGDWKSMMELYYESSQGKEKLKLRCCLSFLESTNKQAISNSSISNVSVNNAKLKINISNPLSQQISEIGYYIGLSNSNMTLVSQAVSSTEKTVSTDIDIRSTYHSLSPGTTYFLKSYALIGGQKKIGTLMSFSTTGNCYGRIDTPIVEKISSNRAVIATRFYNKDALQISQIGYFIGVNTRNMKNISFDVDIYENTYRSFDTSLRGMTLTPNTKYYFQAFMILNDAMYLSDVILFETSNGTNDTVNVSFDANGGANAPDKEQLAYGSTFSLPDDEPNRPDYDFLGWSTNPKALYPEFWPGDSFQIKKDLTLYAVWQHKSENVDTEHEEQTDTSPHPNTDTDTDKESTKLGDVNANGEINLADVVIIQKVLAGLVSISDYGKNAQMRADVDKSGKVNLVDVTLIQKFVANLIINF